MSLSAVEVSPRILEGCVIVCLCVCVSVCADGKMLKVVGVAFAAAPKPPMSSPCSPSPCGTNALCRSVGARAECSCPPELQGNPFVRCSPECETDSMCPNNRACVRRRCVDPCPGACGLLATCQVLQHRPVCACPEGLMGDPYSACRPTPTPIQCEHVHDISLSLLHDNGFLNV